MSEVAENTGKMVYTPAYLSPKCLEESDNSYHSVKYLYDAIRKDDVYNVAVSGPYCSGKSSILKTFSRLNEAGQFHKRYSVLSISLATSASIEAKEQDGGSKTALGIAQSVEYSILQQILFRERHSKLPASNFVKIPYRNIWENISIVEMAVIAVLSVIYLILGQKTLIGICFVAVCLLALFAYIVCNIVLGNRYPHLESVKVKNLEMRLNHFSPDSIFNKYIDEIVYFFKRTDYDVVIFEDIDRFENPDLFFKLREINTILNNNKDIISRDERSRIVFVYALRDDIFKNATDRTKFFDAIIPVIPFINYENSEIQLRKELEQRGFPTWTESNALKDISFFLTDMRLLKNVTNEFAQFADGLGFNDETDQNQKVHLLALLLYKNLNPVDFNEIHNGKGTLVEIFNSLSGYMDMIERRIDKEIDKLEKEAEEMRARSNLKKSEIRIDYITKALGTEAKSVENIFVSDSWYKVKDIASSENLFDVFRAGNSMQVIVNDAYRHNVQTDIRYDFETVEKEVDAEHTYLSKINEIDHSMYVSSFMLTDKRQEKKELRYMSPEKLFGKYGVDNNYYKFSEKNIAPPDPVLVTMIKLGYIGKDYMSYLSYYFKGGMSSSDWAVLQDMKFGKTIPFTKHIDNVEKLCINIPDYVLETDAILVVDIVGFASRHKEMVKKLWEQIKKRVIRNESLPFLAEYFRYEPDNKDVLSLAIDRNFLFWSELSKLDKRDSSKLREVFLLYADKDRFNASVVEWLNGHCDFVDDFVNMYGIETISAKILQCRFKEIKCTDNDFFEYIVNNSLYILNKYNLAYICSRILQYDILESELSMTTVLRTKNEKLIATVKASMAFCIDKIFSDKKDQSVAEEAVLMILNDASIDDNQIFPYLSKRPIISDISKVVEKRRGLAFENEVAVVSWWNIETYFSYVGVINDFLAGYLDSNYAILEKTKSQYRHNKKFAAEFAVLGSISLTAYKKLLPIVCKGYDIKNGDIGTLPENKVHALINNGILPFSLVNKKAVEEFSPELKVHYYKKYHAAFKESAAEVSVSPEEWCLIYKQETFDKETTFKLLNKFTVDDYNASPMLSTEACRFLNDISESLNAEIWLAIIHNSIDYPAAVSLSVSLMENKDNGQPFFLSLIRALPGKLGKIADSSVIVKNDCPFIEKFLILARELGFINNFFPVENGFRVSHKRNEK